MSGLILASTGAGDLIRLVSSAAATLDVLAVYMDNNAGTITPDRVGTAITTATTTTVVGSPAAGVLRNVKFLNVRNKHATLSCDVTMTYSLNGTVYELFKATLRAGEHLYFNEDVGWIYVPNNGNAAQRMAALTADQSNSTVTLTEVTNLSLTTGLGIFAFKYLIVYQNGATTTGVRFSVNHSGTVSFLVANVHHVDATATAATAAASQVVTGAVGQVYSVFPGRSKSTTGWGTTISVDSANTDMLAVIEGLMGVTADGDIELWHGSEVAAISTVRAGSSLILTRTGD